jgi:hypothetical protein
VQWKDLETRRQKGKPEQVNAEECSVCFRCQGSAVAETKLNKCGHYTMYYCKGERAEKGLINNSAYEKFC